MRKGGRDGDSEARQFSNPAANHQLTMDIYERDLSVSSRLHVGLFVPHVGCGFPSLAAASNSHPLLPREGSGGYYSCGLLHQLRAKSELQTSENTLQAWSDGNFNMLIILLKFPCKRRREENMGQDESVSLAAGQRSHQL